MTERPSALDLLYQSEIWIDADGHTHQIADMETRHARNVIRMLERKANHFHSAANWGYVSGPGPSGDAACDAFNAEMDRFMDADPLEWIRSSDLVQALYERIGEPVPGQADEEPWDIPDARPGTTDYTLQQGRESTGIESTFRRPAHRYSVVEADGAHCVAQRSGWQVAYILRYTRSDAARDAADYLNTLTRWEITP